MLCTEILIVSRFQRCCICSLAPLRFVFPFWGFSLNYQGGSLCCSLLGQGIYGLTYGFSTCLDPSSNVIISIVKLAEEVEKVLNSVTTHPLFLGKL